MPVPFTFTFYSFKGGVGRSMALLNVAYTLASRGRHVLILDMDLEAPGIYGFLERTGEFAPAEIEKSADILDLLAAAVEPSRRGDDLAAIADQMPPLSQFIRSVADEKLAPLKPNSPKSDASTSPVQTSRETSKNASPTCGSMISRPSSWSTSAMFSVPTSSGSDSRSGPWA